MLVDLKLDVARIRIEGELGEIKEVLETYWNPLVKTYVSSSKITEKTPRPATGRASTSKPRSQKMPAKDQAISSFDAQAVSNGIKSDERFGTIKSRILDIPGRWLEKSKLIALLIDGPITSGDVKRVYDELKIKTDLPTISKALSGNSTQFITSGTNPKTYEMTLATKEAFERWLFSDDGE